MKTKVITLPAFHIAGYAIEATVEEFESGLGKRQYQKLVALKNEIQHTTNDNVILMQLYPMNEDFDAKVDQFTHLVGYEVSKPGAVPAGMIIHDVPNSSYVVCTHEGQESEIGETYDYIYGEWFSKSGYEPQCYDFEVWDERYQPESEDNVIDIYVALQ